MPTVLARAAAVSRNDRIVTEWDHPNPGIRVHVLLSGETETTFISDAWTPSDFAMGKFISDTPTPKDFAIGKFISDAPTPSDVALGIEGLKSTLEICRLCVDGVCVVALLSSDTPGWDSEVKREVIDVLFQPSIQLYLVASPEADAAKPTEQ